MLEKDTILSCNWSNQHTLRKSWQILFKDKNFFTKSQYGKVCKAYVLACDQLPTPRTHFVKRLQTHIQSHTFQIMKVSKYVQMYSLTAPCCNRQESNSQTKQEGAGTKSRCWCERLCMLAMMAYSSKPDCTVT